MTCQIPCQVKKLDTILQELYRSLERKIDFAFLKSDTQSGEGFVLQGAEQYLREDCLALELELNRYPLCKGMFLENEIKTFLAERGFRVAGWTGYQNSFASQADYLFVRETPCSPRERATIALIESIYNPSRPQRKIKQPSLKARLAARVRRATGSLSAHLGRQ
ncbi:hypothetical protein [Gloeobacter violaceus]|uniref:Glr3779 protein n=1 Tax=Gloeobacter violaceus (strain ATCC 29082 / PCC 7421) TaxID=251221 RepID=Q7NEU9_GLOVI|nr:hypothetical protein [Gloeobacter violaceus]BAC91720.1 glr3779 [Gloeobacter violaceus PCC 7421]